jgi:hypothetical protein
MQGTEPSSQPTVHATSSGNSSSSSSSDGSSTTTAVAAPAAAAAAPATATAAAPIVIAPCFLLGPARPATDGTAVPVPQASTSSSTDASTIGTVTANSSVQSDTPTGGPTATANGPANGPIATAFGQAIAPLVTAAAAGLQPVPAAAAAAASAVGTNSSSITLSMAAAAAEAAASAATREAIAQSVKRQPAACKQMWAAADDARLKQAVEEHGPDAWQKVTSHLPAAAPARYSSVYLRVTLSFVGCLSATSLLCCVHAAYPALLSNTALRIHTACHMVIALYILSVAAVLHDTLTHCNTMCLPAYASAYRLRRCFLVSVRRSASTGGARSVQITRCANCRQLPLLIAVLVALRCVRTYSGTSVDNSITRKPSRHSSSFTTTNPSGQSLTCSADVCLSCRCDAATFAATYTTRFLTVLQGPWKPEDDKLVRELVGQFGAQKVHSCTHTHCTTN